MTFATYSVPADFAQAIDDLARFRALKAEIERAETKLVASIKKRGIGVYVGRNYDAVVFQSVREIIDSEAVRGLLNHETLKKVLKTSIATTVKVMPKSAVIAEVAA